MTIYQQALASRAPEMNALHMESLAYCIGSTLNGMPAEFFDEIAAMAQRMGPDRLRALHEAESCADHLPK